ncbi:MAG: tetratricopeptide repeat protein [Bacteroidota bacterium]
MNKFKSGLLFFAAVFFSGLLKAQTLEEGKKFMYYERYKSAKGVFEKLVAANPNNVDAVYWLGQAMVLPEENSDVAGAKALYQKTLMNNSNSALLLAGMGHIELLEGKAQDAKNRFETAVSISQGKNKDVLNAIGFANVQAPNGDADYAVQKLRQATELKKMTDPDVWANLGDAYKKLIQGAPAQTAYEAALGLSPNYARASYRIGKIYQTQGIIQKEIYMRYYDEAIAKDPAYAPVYENLYQYYYGNDVTKSGEYMDKYLANTDVDAAKDCSYRTSMLYARGMFNESISKGQQCIASAGPEGPYPNIYAVVAYAYFKLGDSLNAKTYFDTYFQKQKPEKVGPVEYKTYGQTLIKLGQDSVGGIYIDKAVALDSTETGKIALLKDVAMGFEAQKKFKEAGGWYNKLLSVKQNTTKTDLYNAGYNLFRGGDYTTALSIFNIYSQKFPDDPFGYYLSGKSSWAIDTTLEQGLANPYFEKTIEVASKDSVKNKAQLIGSYKYFLVYSVFKKDKAAAIEYADKILLLDPADAETMQNRELLTKPATTPATKQPAKPAPAKPTAGAKSGGTKKK